MSRTLSAAAGLMAAAALMAAVSGCSKNRKRLPVYKARGQVLVGEKPAAGVFIYLWPASVDGVDAYCPHAQTDENGRFTLSTYDPDDGAPAGDYAVTAEWPARFNPISNRWEGDKFKGRHADQKTSKISVTVRKGENELPVVKLEP